jgi:hypothetical protein
LADERTAARSAATPPPPSDITERISIMKLSALTLVVSLAFATAAHADGDPKTTIADLGARLDKIGAPKIEGTSQLGDKTVPALYFGERKINGNYDVVDAIRKASSATATVFVKDGTEFVRVSTNVLTPEGKRGVGTTLAHNAAYEAVSKGSQFCGAVDVLGTAYDACYNPIKDASGKLVAVSYVGLKK